jgi:hypothetical protein
MEEDLIRGVDPVGSLQGSDAMISAPKFALWLCSGEPSCCLPYMDSRFWGSV